MDLGDWIRSGQWRKREGDGDMHKVNMVGPWPTADRSPATLGFLTETSIGYKKGSGWQRRLRRTHL